MNWPPEAKQYLIDRQYSDLANFYERKIETNAEDISNYCYLGLAYLLQGKEQKAQITWFYILNLEEGKYLSELVAILDEEAKRQELIQNYQYSRLIRSHIREIDSQLINNILELIKLEIKLNVLSEENLEKYQLEKLLKLIKSEDINLELLWEVLPNILLLLKEKALNITELSLNHVNNLENCVKKLDEVSKIFQRTKSEFSLQLTQLCLKLKPADLYLLNNLSWGYFYNHYDRKALELANLIYQKSETISMKVVINAQILQFLQTRAAWLEIENIAKRHKVLLMKAIEEQQCPKFIRDKEEFLVLTAAKPLLYQEDKPEENHWLQNQIAKLFQAEISKRNVSGNNENKLSLRERIKRNQDKLRIGYIAHTLRRHSVGWLSRWLFKYHNHQKFEIFIYLIQQVEDHLTKEWFYGNADKFYNLPSNPRIIAEQIRSDQIDILVDLDSITNHVTCVVMSLKPAPLQITWLGMDASGIPNIDYFIADSFVLPSNAQEYYQEKIWHLPNTYIAVDGFEKATPTLNRKNLEIPDNAIIFFTAQAGFKRHPDLIRLQMSIIKKVPHSYLLIKGWANEDKIKQLFVKIATEVGVRQEQLRFLPGVKLEETHRANLVIADVVLDTYPYNGATTTLETLWMEIPIVTKVGKQFAARNTYGFMMNVGVTEGIAWSDEEYIEWGVKLGTDENLRRQVVWKLRQSKRSSPLWNGRQFTREMEQAYRQMWDKYINGTLARI